MAISALSKSGDVVKSLTERLELSTRKDVAMRLIAQWSGAVFAAERRV